MRFNFLLGITFFFFLSCDDTLEFNPLDPGNPDYEPPETIFTIEELEGALLDTSTVTITWQGNDLVIEYATSFNGGAWSEWSADTSVTLSYLDEGEYTFSVKGRYESEVEDETPATVSFTVDMVQGAGIRVYTLYKEGSIGEETEVHIYAEEVEGLVLAEFQIAYDPLIINLIELSPGELVIEPYTLISEILTPGLINVNLAVLENDGISGTGSIAVFKFECSALGSTEIEILNPVFRDVNTNDIPIMDSANGLVVVQ